MAAIAGCVWVEGTEFHYIAPNGTQEYKYIGEFVDTAVFGALPGCVWIDGEYLNFIDQYGNWRVIAGIDDGLKTALAGCIWIETISSVPCLLWISATLHKRHGHYDVAHTDEAHGDIPIYTDHGNVAHGDVSHVNSGYSDHDDVAHVDSHTDTHGDHDDGHGDHDDTYPAHIDWWGHYDVAHQDEYGDTAHEDHQDDTHGNVAHTDTHTDHQDDTVHTDDAFQDIPHDDQPILVGSV